jgi:hypothetical protein
MASLLRTGIAALVRPAPAIALAAGFGLGALCMMPLGFAVTDAEAGVMGAFAAALGSIGAALAIVHYQGYMQARNVCEFISNVIDPLVWNAFRFGARWFPVQVDGKWERTNHDWRDIEWGAEYLLADIGKIVSRLQRVSPMIPSMRANAILRFARIEETLGVMKEQLEALRHEAGRRGVITDPDQLFLLKPDRLLNSFTDLGTNCSLIASEYGITRGNSEPP